MDNNLDIRDNEINVEEIMHEIRERVRKQKSEVHSTESVSNTINIPAQTHDILPVQTLPNGSNPLNSMWDIRDNTYTITSHRKYLGKFLVKGRQIVNGEVRRYIDPIIWKQSSFNEQVALLCSLYEKRILDLEDTLVQQNNLNLQKYKDLEDTLVQQNDLNLQKYKDLHQFLLKIEEKEKQIISDITHIRSEQSNNCKKVSGLKRIIEQKNVKSLSNIREYLKDEITSIISNKNPDSDKRLSLYGISKPGIMDYFAFEEHFRGSRTEIKKRQLKYIPFFEHCTNVLDIGCGRGEFLELLRDHEIPGGGIDINKEMVNYCFSKGFKAFQEDAIIYLRLLDDNCLDGIFSDQVIEHLTSEYLVSLLDQAYRKLKTDSHIILGTVNILNPGGLANFFVDPTHVSPIHPAYLKYCLETAGFRDIQILFRTYDDRETDPSSGNLELIAADYVMVGKK